MKLLKYIRIISFSFVLPAYFSMALFHGETSNTSFNDSSALISKTSSKLNSNESQIDVNNMTYSHTNYTSFQKNDLPSDFSFDYFSQTNSSMLIQTEEGFLNFSSDHKKIFFYHILEELFGFKI